MDLLSRFINELKAIPFALITLSLALGILSPHLAVMALVLSFVSRFSLLRAYAMVAIVGATTIMIQYREAPARTKGITTELEVTECYGKCHYGCIDLSSGKEVALELNRDRNIERGDLILGKFKFIDIDQDILSAMSTFNYLKAEGYRVVALPYDEVIVDIHKQRKPWYRSLQLLAVEKLSSLDMPQEKIAIITALITGHREIGKKSSGLFRRAGITHILAVSGLHVGIVAAIVTLLLCFMRSYRMRIVRSIITIVAVIIYALFTGWAPSVQRATIMFTLIVIANYSSARVRSSYNALFFAAYIIILFTPASLWDIGFYLSFIAVLSIIYFAPRLLALSGRVIKRQNRLIRYIFAAIGTTIAAQILLTPIQLYLFGSISTVSIFSNAIIVAIIPALILLGFIYLALPLPILSTPIEWLLETVEYISKAVTSLPHSFIYGIEFSTNQLIISYIIIATAMVYIKIREYKRSNRRDKLTI